MRKQQTENMKYGIQHDPPHPGKILREYMRDYSLNVSLGSAMLEIARPNLSAILNARAGISVPMSFKLAEFFNNTPQYWLNLQMNYDLYQELKKR